MTYAYDNHHLHKLFEDTKKQYYDNCKSAINQLVTLYPNYNFPSSPTSSMDKCQIAALDKWNEELQKGTKGIGDTDTPWWYILSKTDTQVQDTDELMFKQIRDNISTTHAHEKIKEFISKTDAYIQSQMVPVVPVNPGIKPQPGIKPLPPDPHPPTPQPPTPPHTDVTKSPSFIQDAKDVVVDGVNLGVSNEVAKGASNVVTEWIFKKNETFANMNALFMLENNIEELKNKIITSGYDEELDTKGKYTSQYYDTRRNYYENQLKVYEELKKIAEREFLDPKMFDVEEIK